VLFYFGTARLVTDDAHTFGAKLILAFIINDTPHGRRQRGAVPP